MHFIISTLMHLLPTRPWILIVICHCVLPPSVFGSTFEQGTHSGPFLSTSPRFNIVVVVEGPSDHTTALVFHDIAQIVQGGLHNLGYPSRVVYCTNLVADRCFVEGERLIVLAPHNLASYILDGQSAVLEKQLLPPDAVLYNFEHVPGQWPPEDSSVAHSRQRDKSLLSARTLQIYARFVLWDYSEGNVEKLLDFGIHAKLLPLGFSPELSVSNLHKRATRWDGGDQEDIDVLFIGMETPRRKATIQRLRDAGIAVVHPNSSGRDLYGAEFDALSAKSKVVLNLNAFEATAATNRCSSSSSSSSSRRSSSSSSDEPPTSESPSSSGEWKMPRLARLLANERFIISEIGGTASERIQLSGGLVFVTSERLAEACRYYLERPDLRRTIAERGRQLFEERREADILRGPVEDLLQGKRRIRDG